MNKKNITLIIIGLAAAAVLYIIISGSAKQVGSEPGDRAPDFSLPSYENDEETALSDYRDSLVILNMWASWCEPCVRELPALLEIHENYNEEGVEVITMNMNSYERTQEEAETFAAEFNLTRTPSAIDMDGDVADAYQLQYLPTTVIIDRDGIIIEKIAGEITYERMEQIIEENI